MLIAEDFENLLKVLPHFVQNTLKKDPNADSLVEVVLDLGRMPEARFLDTPVFLSDHLIVWKDIDFLIKRIGKFSPDNRAGIERTLHRISSIRNRENVIIGLTCRVGRAVLGVISIIRDLIEEEESILILGKPGVGKTTAVREISRILSDEMGKRVVIIDTSNEIAGDGDIPHPAIGSSRRMQVSHPELQHRIMIEAVENHMPQVIIIDEISTELEALAARTIAERGVKLIATAHGNSLESLIKNPTLSDLIGGIQYVTLGDEEARNRGTQKSILERKARPAFKIGVEISDPKTWVVHPNIEKAVDQILQTYRSENQVRIFAGNKFRQIIQCKFSNFDILYVFENTFLRISSVQKNILYLNRELWFFEWS
jgi:stage III sporulation protein SpoIIIAA